MSTIVALVLIARVPVDGAAWELAIVVGAAGSLASVLIRPIGKGRWWSL